MRSYPLGINIVLVTLIISSAVCLALVDTKPSPQRAALDLGLNAPKLGGFSFTERSGRPITDADLKDKVWVGAFIFTRCKSSCPIITSVMSRLQQDLADTPIQLVSISVDPDHDTPEVLSEFARAYRADKDRWWFLTGDKEATYALIRDGFLQSVSETTEEDQASGAEAIAHSFRIALIVPGNQVVGFYSSTDESEIEILKRRAIDLSKQSLAPTWARKLPKVNASLNATSAALLVLGLSLIRTGRRRAHTVTMILALLVSALFLVSYLVYHYHVGSVKFPAFGLSKLIYLTILLSHTILAILLVPLIVVTVIHAVRGAYDRHRKASTVTYPIWLYVSTTGVVIYWLLYQVDWSATLSA